MQAILLYISAAAPQIGVYIDRAKWKRILLHDPRINQIMFLGSFLLYGIFALSWEAEITRYIITISTCLITQVAFTFFTTKNYASLKSAMITGLGLSLLFRSTDPLIIILCCVLAIGSKFLIRYKGKHFFNPGNFGIVVAILLTGQGWISPGQWGSSEVLVAFFLITGLNVLLKVGRMDTGIIFLATFAGLQFVYHVLYLNWPVDHFYHQLTSGTLLLFAFFMITDPVTTPNAPKARIIWAVLVGLLSFILTKWFFVFTAPLWALFFIAPLTVLFDKIFIHQKFKWSQS